VAVVMSSNDGLITKTSMAPADWAAASGQSVVTTIINPELTRNATCLYVETTLTARPVRGTSADAVFPALNAVWSLEGTGHTQRRYIGGQHVSGR